MHIHEKKIKKKKVKITVNVWKISDPAYNRCIR